MELIKFISKKKQKPIGVLTANEKDGHLYVGWSLCCKEDVFNEETGVQGAKLREAYEIGLYTVPHSIRREFTRFANHARRYFIYKGAKIL